MGAGGGEGTFTGAFRGSTTIGGGVSGALVTGEGADVDATGEGGGVVTIGGGTILGVSGTLRPLFGAV